MNTYDIILLLANVFDCYVIIRFMRLFFPDDTMNRKAAAFVYTLRYAAVCLISIFLPYPVLMLTVSVTGLFFVTLCYRSSFPRKIFACVSAYTVMFASELIAAVFAGMNNISPVAKSEHGSSLSLIIYELIALVIVTLLSNFRHTNSDFPVQWIFFFAVLAVSAATVCLEIQIFMQPDISDMTYALSVVCILMLNFLVFYLHDSISAAFKSRMRSELERRENEYYRSQVSLIERNYRELGNFRHDMKNRLIALQQLISQSKSDEALEYLYSITDKLDSINLYSKTGCIETDSLLNYKLTLAEESGITVRAEIMLPEKLSADKDDMLVIFGNLLDNAIEACMKAEGEKFIELNVRFERGTVIIRMKNSFDGKLIEKSGKLMTTKGDGFLHGRGLESIESNVKKYSGTVETSHSSNVFETNILLFV